MRRILAALALRPREIAIKVIALDVGGLALSGSEKMRARGLRYDPVSRLDVDAATREALARHH